MIMIIIMFIILLIVWFIKPASAGGFHRSLSDSKSP